MTINSYFTLPSTSNAASNQPADEQFFANSLRALPEELKTDILGRIFHKGPEFRLKLKDNTLSQQKRWDILASSQYYWLVKGLSQEAFLDDIHSYSISILRKHATFDFPDELSQDKSQLLERFFHLMEAYTGSKAPFTRLTKKELRFYFRTPINEVFELLFGLRKNSLNMRGILSLMKFKLNGILENLFKHNPSCLAVLQGDLDKIESSKPLNFKSPSPHEKLTPLMLAAGIGQLEAAEKILKIDPPCIGAKGLRKLQAIHYAVFSGHLDIVQMFLKKDPQLAHAADSDGRQPIHYAAKRGHLAIFEKLLEMDPRLAHATDLNGKLPIHYALSGMKPGIFEKLLEMDPGFVHIADRHGERPIHYALKKRVLGILEKLLEMDPQFAYITDSDGWQPIHYAAKEGHLGILGKSLEIDPKLAHAADRHGGQPIHHAAKEGHLDIFEKLLETDPKLAHATDRHGGQPIHYAAWTGGLDIFEKLIELDIGLVYAADLKGLQPIHYVLKEPFLCELRERRKIDILGKLLEIDPRFAHVSDSDGKLPIHLAAKKGYLDIFGKLLEIDPKLVYAKDSDGKEPIDYAKKSPNILKKLIKFSDCIPQDSDDPIPLQLASGISRVLDTPGNQLDQVRIKNGGTILHWIAAKGDFKFLEEVLNRSSPLFTKIRDNEGNTAMHVAAAYGASFFNRKRLTCMEVLLKHDPSLNTVQNNQGKTLYDISSRGITILIFMNWLIRKIERIVSFILYMPTALWNHLSI